MKNKKVTILPKQKYILEILGENIKLARKRRKLTCNQVSERANINRTTLYRAEKGDPSVSIGTYFNILKIFNLEKDFPEVAKDDIFGRKLQDLDLLNSEDKNPIQKKISFLRNKLSVAVLRKKVNKNSDFYKILGCDYRELKKHLETNPYGFKMSDENIDIDHIVPLKKELTYKSVERLSHYTNLQLLPSYYNRYIKRDKKWNPIEFKKWFNNF